MNTIQKKIQATSRIVAVVTKILYVTAIIVVFFGVCGIVWQMIWSDNNSFTLGHIKIISPILFAANQGIPIDLFTGIANQFFVIAILITTNRIFKDISREYSPFLLKNIRRMKKIAMLIL